MMAEREEKPSHGWREENRKDLYGSERIFYALQLPAGPSYGMAAEWQSGSERQPVSSSFVLSLDTETWKA